MPCARFCLPPSHRLSATSSIYNHVRCHSTSALLLTGIQQRAHCHCRASSTLLVQHDVISRKQPALPPIVPEPPVVVGELLQTITHVSKHTPNIPP